MSGELEAERKRLMTEYAAMPLDDCNRSQLARLIVHTTIAVHAARVGRRFHGVTEGTAEQP